MNVCPVCQKDDQLIKIASIVEAGTHHLSGSSEAWVSNNRSESWSDGHWTTVPVTAIQRSKLASILALPPEPAQPIKFGTGLVVGLIILSLFVVGNTVLSFLCNSSLVRERNYLIEILSLLGCAAVPVVITLIQLYRVRTSKARYTLEKPKWDKAWRVWNRLYYCFRDNIIYDPEAEKYFDVSTFKQYINAN